MTTLQLTINGETRDVECFSVWADGSRMMTVERVGAFQKSAGTKLWAEKVDFFKQPDGSFKPNMFTTILNRSGYKLVGWAEIVDRNPSAHNSAGMAKV